VIDYEQLAQLLCADTTPQNLEASRQLVDQYIAENKSEIIQLKVDPGLYSFEFFANPHRALAKEHDAEQPSPEKPFLTLQQSPEPIAALRTKNKIK